MELMYLTIIITGGTGFIGSFLAREFCQKSSEEIIISVPSEAADPINTVIVLEIENK